MSGATSEGARCGGRQTEMSCQLRGGGGSDGVPRRRRSGEGGRAGLGREASARREEPVQVLSLSGKRPEVGAQR